MYGLFIGTVVIGRLMFSTEDGENNLLRNIGKHINHKAEEHERSLSNCQHFP
jgi:hypothetical protein